MPAAGHGEERNDIADDAARPGEHDILDPEVVRLAPAVHECDQATEQADDAVYRVTVLEDLHQDDDPADQCTQAKHDRQDRHGTSLGSSSAPDAGRCDQAIRSRPFRYSRSTSGTVTEPSAFW